MNNSQKNKFLSKTELSKLRENHKNKKIILCHGVFDVLHHGHILHLKSAKKFGDILVVSLTSDNFVIKDQTDHSTMKYLDEVLI